MKPEFPIKVYFDESGEVWEFNDEAEAAMSLEWFDSRDPEENARVLDHQSRRVHLKVEKLEIQLCELES